VQCGVPQGSTLGPLLFLLYINDLAQVLDQATPSIFADDTSLLMSGSDLPTMVSTMNSQLSIVNSWLQANRLSLNLTKTYSMLFSLNRGVQSGPLMLAIDGIPIERVHTIRYLGIIIDDRLTWAAHIDHIAKKISRSVGILNRVKHCLNQKTLLLLYHTLIFPYLTYSHLVWGKAALTYLKRLVILQKKSVRIITHSDYYAHTNPLFIRLENLHLHDLYTFLWSIFVFKCLKHLFPSDFLSYYNLISILSRNDRRSQIVYVSFLFFSSSNRLLEQCKVAK